MVPKLNNRFYSASLIWIKNFKLVYKKGFISEIEFLITIKKSLCISHSTMPKASSISGLLKHKIYCWYQTWVYWNSVSNREKSCIIMLLSKDIIAQSNSCSSICGILKWPVCTWSEITACTINIIYSKITVICGSIVMWTCIDWFFIRVQRTLSSELRTG